MPGHLILIPTPLGNLGDLTHRAVQALEGCDLVACEDTRRTGGLLAHLGIDKPLQRFDDHASQDAFNRVAALFRNTWRSPPSRRSALRMPGPSVSIAVSQR